MKEHNCPYKIGDILICKKELIHPDKGVILIKNIKYIIELTGIASTHPTNPSVQIRSGRSGNSFKTLFFLESNSLKKYDYYFYDYFYTLKEERKLKLEKLNGNKR